ncbi:MAG TPA: hypothetical protein VG204_14475 [Terriglobia bacterium]|nr:hypothetical protein [Terriglobia bacterium]
MRRRLPATSESITHLGMQLREMGWSPLGSTVAHRGAELALGQPTPSSTLYELTSASFNDDFVFLVSGVLYFAFESERGETEKRSTLEAGAIHELGTPPPAELARLTSSLDAALARLTGDAAKSGVNGGTWQELPWHPLSSAFAGLRERAMKQAGGSVSAGFPDFPEDVRQALRVLEDPERRKLALRIKASEPLFVVREQEADSLNTASDALVDAGLAIRKILVRCRKRSDVNLALLSTEDPARLEGECPHCRSKLRDEQFLKGLAPTALGSNLLDHSHWMTSRVAQSLRNCGVPPEDVLTEVSTEGGELDFLVSLYGSLAVMELKDRTFSIDDARDLFDRYLRFGAQELIAVTTETIAPEARRRLEEAVRAVPRQPAPSITFVEGLAEMDAKVRLVVQRANWRAVARLLDKVASAAMPLDAKALVAAKFGIPISKDRRAHRGSASTGFDETMHEYLDLLAEVDVKSYS